METKSILVSKTVWLNVVMGVLVALVPVLPGAEHWADLIKANLGSIAAVWAVLGVLVRLITKSKIVFGD